ncbi:MAG: hypothetical protein GY749_47415 [Desulfobacteraceae bacterium]|nr:hypothetical protein [Desulfobacteraceae bacterium]
MSESSKTENRIIPLDELVAEIDAETLGTGEEETADSRQDIAEKLSGHEQYIRFYLEDIQLAIPLSSAIEIGNRPNITTLPNLPDWVLGVSNIRGEVISMVELKTFFGLQLTKKRYIPASQKMTIIVRNEDMKVGMIVDRVMGIFYLDRSDKDIQKSPYEEAKSELISYISGVVAPGESSEENLMNILDINKLLSSQRMNAFRSEK